MRSEEDLSRLDLEILSDVLLLALHSSKYKDISINEFYNKFIETIKIGDFQLTRDEKKDLPIAFTSWSFVSDEVLSDMIIKNRNIKQEEINSGNNLLFIELFSSTEYYWDFFDHITDYFNNEYEGQYPLDKNKIYTCCGLKIGFDKAGVRIVRMNKNE